MVLMKKFSKLFGFIAVFIVMMATMCSLSFAATVGQKLTSPEDGSEMIGDIFDKTRDGKSR